MSELECFHSPVLDMDYIFFNMGVICWPLVGREGLGGCEKVEPADCGLRRKWVAVSWKGERVHRLLEKMVTEGHEKCENCTL